MMYSLLSPLCEMEETQYLPLVSFNHQQSQDLYLHLYESKTCIPGIGGERLSNTPLVPLSFKPLPTWPFKNANIAFFLPFTRHSLQGKFIFVLRNSHQEKASRENSWFTTQSPATKTLSHLGSFGPGPVHKGISSHQLYSSVDEASELALGCPPTYWLPPLCAFPFKSTQFLPHKQSGPLMQESCTFSPKLTLE